jgi:hypothetical protein
VGLNSTVLLTCLNYGRPEREMRSTSIVDRISKSVHCSYDSENCFFMNLRSKEEDCHTFSLPYIQIKWYTLSARVGG